METKKRKRSGLNVGSSLILVTFILLCLVAFAALSFTSANSDYELSKQTADKTSNYYNATSSVELHLSEYDIALKDIAASSDSNDAFITNIKTAYATDAKLTVTEVDSGILLQFIVPIDSKSGISVALAPKNLDAITDNEASFDITSYQTITTTAPGSQTIQDNGGFLF